MKATVKIFGALIILLTVISCKQPVTTANNDEADKAAISAVIKKHLDAVDALDMPAILSCMVEDHVEMAPNTPKIVGKQPYADYFSSFVEFFKTLKNKEMSFIPSEFIVSGDWAFQIGTYTTRFKLQDDNVIEDTGNYVWIFKKENDGTWKWARVISNSNKPAQGT
jgi:ketosteroid isomerase-like protein